MPWIRLPAFLTAPDPEPDTTAPRLEPADAHRQHVEDVAWAALRTEAQRDVLRRLARGPHPLFDEDDIPTDVCLAPPDVVFEPLPAIGDDYGYEAEAETVLMDDRRHPERPTDAVVLDDGASHR